MDTTQTIYFILSSLLVMLPQLLVIIGGMFWAFSNMSRNPQVGRTALAGLGIMLFIGLLGLAVTAIQIQLPALYGIQSYTMISYIATAVRFILNIVWAIGLGLLIYAVWVGRNDK